MTKTYVIYDERANVMDTDDCIAIDTAETEQEAIRIAKKTGGVAFSYNVIGDQLADEEQLYN